MGNNIDTRAHKEQVAGVRACNLKFKAIVPSYIQYRWQQTCDIFWYSTHTHTTKSWEESISSWPGGLVVSMTSHLQQDVRCRLTMCVPITHSSFWIMLKPQQDEELNKSSPLTDGKSQTFMCRMREKTASHPTQVSWIMLKLANHSRMRN